MYTHMADVKVTACAKISQELYDQSIQKYNKISLAIIAGLELLNNEKSIPNNEENILNNKESIRYAELQTNILHLTTRLEEKERELQTNELNKNMIIAEKDKQIEMLSNELDANHQMHNNYVLQMQTLINQKLIGTKKPFWKFW